MAVRSADLRYAGQGYELNVPADREMLASFHREHGRRYGHTNPERTLEVVNVRVRLIASGEKIQVRKAGKAGAEPRHAWRKTKPVMFGDQWLETGFFDRDRLRPGNRLAGPAIVHEYSATTVIPPGALAEVDEFSNLVIEV
jgi:N-methylhydantoinase A